MLPINSPAKINGNLTPELFREAGIAVAEAVIRSPGTADGTRPGLRITRSSTSSPRRFALAMRPCRRPCLTR